MGLRRCRLSAYKQNKLLEFFLAEVTARTAADLVGVNRHTATLFYQKIRQIIATNVENETPFSGPVEVDESYFGGKRKGKRGRGAAGKVPVFGILERGGKVYTQVINNVKAETLVPIVQQKVQPDSIVYSDTLPSYNALDVSGFHHLRINHSKKFVSRGKHINGIENFWNQAKRILRKYNGVPKESFYLFLKECEFRFNYGTPKQQLRTLRKWCNITTK